MFETIKTIVEFIADLGTVCGFGVAIWLYFTKKGKLSSLYSVLIGLRNQESYRDIHKLLDKLERLNYGDKAHRSEIRNSLSELNGLISGNPLLAEKTTDITEQLKILLEKGADEPSKRHITAHIRERIRGMTYDNVQQLTETTEK